MLLLNQFVNPKWPLLKLQLPSLRNFGVVHALTFIQTNIKDKYMSYCAAYTGFDVYYSIYRIVMEVKYQ